MQGSVFSMGLLSRKDSGANSKKKKKHLLKENGLKRGKCFFACKYERLTDLHPFRCRQMFILPFLLIPQPLNGRTNASYAVSFLTPLTLF